MASDAFIRPAIPAVPSVWPTVHKLSAPNTEHTALTKYSLDTTDIQDVICTTQFFGEEHRLYGFRFLRIASWCASPVGFEILATILSFSWV